MRTTTTYNPDTREVEITSWELRYDAASVVIPESRWLTTVERIAKEIAANEPQPPYAFWLGDGATKGRTPGAFNVIADSV